MFCLFGPYYLLFRGIAYPPLCICACLYAERELFHIFFLVFVLLLGIVFGCEAIIDIMDVKYGATWTNFIPYESTLLSNFVIAPMLMGMNVAIRMVFHNIKSKNAGARSG